MLRYRIEITNFHYTNLFRVFLKKTLKVALEIGLLNKSIELQFVIIEYHKSMNFNTCINLDNIISIEKILNHILKAVLPGISKYISKSCSRSFKEHIKMVQHMLPAALLYYLCAMDQNLLVNFHYNIFIK